MYAVYWAFAQDGTLLYVGFTLDLIQRIETHRRKTEWGKYARWEYHIMPTYGAARRLEIAAIQAGNPVFNVRHRGS